MAIQACVWDSPSPAHRLGYLCCDRSTGRNVLVFSVCSFFGRRLGQRGPEKEDSHLSFSDKDPCASLHEGSLPGDCRQGRTGSSDGNPGTSNPGKFSSRRMGPGLRRVQPCRAFGAGYPWAGAGAWGRGPKVGGLSGGLGAACGRAGTPSFPRAKGCVCGKRPCRSRPGPDRPEAGRPGGLSNGRRGGARHGDLDGHDF